MGGRLYIVPVVVPVRGCRLGCCCAGVGVVRFSCDYVVVVAMFLW